MEQQQQKDKMTRLEKHWVLYDVGNSAFTLLISTILPIYFNGLAESAGLSDAQYLAFWGYAASFVTVVVAVLGPTLGAIADLPDMKKKLFTLCVAVGVIGCAVMGVVSSWVWFLGCFIIAKIGYSASLVFYDSMLTDVTTPERMDKVSAVGYAFGYAGSCIPFVVSLVIVLGYQAIGLTLGAAMLIAFLINAGWWLCCTLPLLASFRQKYSIPAEGHMVADAFRRLGQTFRDIKANKQVLWFLIAFFLYIDGVYTIIDMATAYGQALGLDSTGLLLALLVTQIVAFPFALLFGWLSRRVDVRVAVPPGGHRLPGVGGHRGLHRHRRLRHLPAHPGPVLDPGGLGGHVPGRHPVFVPVLLWQDHPPRKVGGILRPAGYLRQRRLLCGHLPGEPDDPDFGQHLGGGDGDRPPDPAGLLRLPPCRPRGTQE